MPEVINKGHLTKGGETWVGAICHCPTCKGDFRLTATDKPKMRRPPGHVTPVLMHVCPTEGCDTWVKVPVLRGNPGDVPGHPRGSKPVAFKEVPLEPTPQEP